MTWRQRLLGLGASYVGGRAIQHRFGRSGPTISTTDTTPETDTSTTEIDEPDTPQASTYQNEQSSNEYMPEDQPFMGVGFWGGGNALAPVMPTPVLQQSVQQLSDPSNENAYNNRQIASLIPGLVGNAAALVPSLRVLGMLGTMTTGGLLGTEHQASVQSQQTPRLPPNPSVQTDPSQIQQSYQQLSSQYAEEGYTSQSLVTAQMPPTAQNAQVSHAIQRRLMPQRASPFTATTPTEEKKESEVL